MVSFLESEAKPEDWPVNDKEAKLEAVFKAVEKFRGEPSYKTREVMLALINEHDLNQRSYRGMIRITQYEVEMINLLYMMGAAYNINSLKTFLYEIIADTTRMQKMNSWMSQITYQNISINIPEYDEILLLPLKLYHYAYQQFNLDKDKPFAEKIIDLINDLLRRDSSQEMLETLCTAYMQMLNDLSYMHGNKKNAIWEFDREELRALFELEISLIAKLKKNPGERPLKGILMTQISNFILKSRNGYNEDYICKYVSAEVAKAGIKNHQIWMKKTSLLNDKREEKVIPEIFQDNKWIPFSWVHDIDFTETRTYYVSSFSKDINNNKMQNEYGECIYGFKDDHIAELIAPIGEHDMVKRSDIAEDIDLPEKTVWPFISQVLAFDVIYDREEAINELKFMMEIIDKFNIDDCSKRDFLQDIMQYWVLSVKDKKWQKERERRYVLFLYDDYRYTELEIDDVFLKVKTSIFLTPDFILGSRNPTEMAIRRYIYEKRNYISMNGYIYCNDCLNRDYDAFQNEKIDMCPICHSKRIERIYPWE